MSKETREARIESRKVDQYKIYTLVTYLKSQGATKRTDEVETAVFTDKDVLDQYRTALAKDMGVSVDEASYVREAWSDLKPVPENFSLALNPVFEVPEFIKEQRKAKEERHEEEAKADELDDDDTLE